MAASAAALAINSDSDSDSAAKIGSLRRAGRDGDGLGNLKFMDTACSWNGFEG